VQLTNIQGLLRGSNTKGQPIQTIAIVAYYDTLGIAPELATGTDSNGSGVAALIEMARLFSKLYYGIKSQGSYNILFVLTSGGRLNFAGTRHWIKELDPKIRESIEFALCLDTIGTSDPVHLHISKPVQNLDENLRKLYQEFENQAKKMNLPFEIIHKKINMQTFELDWEHQQFSLAATERKVVAATFSDLKTPSPFFTRSNIFDKSNLVDLNSLERNVKFISEVLAKHIYGFHGKDLEIFTGSYAVNKQFIEAWVQTLNQYPRVGPYLTKKDPIVEGFKTALNETTGEIVLQTFDYDNTIKFFESQKTQMSAYKVKPVTFDIYLSLIIAVYLLSLYFVLKYITGRVTPIQIIKQLFVTRKLKR